MDVRVSIRLISFVLAAWLVVASTAISAQDNPAPSASPVIFENADQTGRAAGVTDPGYSSPAASETAKSFDPVSATQAWLATVPTDKRKKSDAYFEGRYWLILWNFLLAAGISIFLLASRISARLRDFAERTCRGSCQLPLQVVLYSIPYFLLMA